MIFLSNGRILKHVIASGAMGFDGRGWFWEWPLVWLGFIKLQFFTIILRTLTKEPRLYPKSNLSWIRPWTWLPFSPWSCVRLIFGGAVNKVGLYNPGIDYWCKHIAPKMDFQKHAFIASIHGNKEELEYMAGMLDPYGFVAVQVNPSCPNDPNHPIDNTETVIRCVKAVKRKTPRHPIIVKLSCDQDCLAIAEGLVGIAEAIELNSVPWLTAFPGKKSPLSLLEKRVGGGGGGVSGKPAQKHNWAVVRALVKQGLIPVIASSIMEFEDIDRVRLLGAKAISYGAIHLPNHPFWLKPWTLFTNPCKPTSFVRKEKKKL